MSDLKGLKDRIASVKSTQKITSAMKMVAAAKLKRAEAHAQSTRPYTEHMTNIMGELVSRLPAESANLPKLLTGTGKNQKHLFVVATSDRGLCGGFNSSIVRQVKKQFSALTAAGKHVDLFLIGRKGHDILRREYHNNIIEYIHDLTKQKLTFEQAIEISKQIHALYDKNEYDVVTLFYNKYKSALTQIVSAIQLIPIVVPKAIEQTSAAIYEYEPSEEQLLSHLLPKNLAVQLFSSLIENVASEQGARMTAMDNATRNAGDMIKDLTLLYNRSRQAVITKELIEIISGAEAL
jgi:F-type H+-transporting ATPase subunit gamma